MCYTNGFSCYVNFMTPQDKGGRPRLPRGERRDVTRSCRLTSGESRLIDRAARARGLAPTQWMREVIVRAAKRAAGRTR